MKAIFSLTLVILFAGCSAKHDPLIYVSTQTFGVKAGASADGTGFKFVVGYAGVDAAYVPTGTRTDKVTEEYHAIRGCSNAGHNIELVTSCENVSSKKQQSPTKNTNSNYQYGYQDYIMNAFQQDPLDTGPGGNQQESISDALSVYGTFDADATVAGSNGNNQINLGKVFSTGVAAQHLTGGISLRERRKNLADILDKRNDVLKSRKECIEKLKEVLGDELDKDSLKVCM